jgi:hypothetical protein
METIKPRLHFPYVVFFGVKKCTDSKRRVISEKWREVMQRDVEMAKCELVLLNFHRETQKWHKSLSAECVADVSEDTRRTFPPY